MKKLIIALLGFGIVLGAIAPAFGMDARAQRAARRDAQRAQEVNLVVEQGHGRGGVLHFNVPRDAARRAAEPVIVDSDDDGADESDDNGVPQVQYQQFRLQSRCPKLKTCVTRAALAAAAVAAFAYGMNNVYENASWTDSNTVWEFGCFPISFYNMIPYCWYQQ